MTLPKLLSFGNIYQLFTAVDIVKVPADFPLKLHQIKAFIVTIKMMYDLVSSSELNGLSKLGCTKFISPK